MLFESQDPSKRVSPSVLVVRKGWNQLVDSRQNHIKENTRDFSRKWGKRMHKMFGNVTNAMVDYDETSIAQLWVCLHNHCKASRLVINYKNKGTHACS